jgi:hypothetical protein
MTASFSREIVMRLPKNLGLLLLGIYLILVGLIAFVPALGQIGPLVPLLALLAGILILLGR